MLVHMPFGQGPEAQTTKLACERLISQQRTAVLEPIVHDALEMLATAASSWSMDQSAQPLALRASSLFETLHREWVEVQEGRGNGFDLCAILADSIELIGQSSDPDALLLRAEVIGLSSKALQRRDSDPAPKKKSAIRWVVPLVATILGATVIGLVWND